MGINATNDSVSEMREDTSHGVLVKASYVNCLGGRFCVHARTWWIIHLTFVAMDMAIQKSR